MCILDDLNKHAITLGNGGLDFEGGFFWYSLAALSRSPSAAERPARRGKRVWPINWQRPQSARETQRKTPVLIHHAQAFYRKQELFLLVYARLGVDAAIGH
jgi:hypothetical protein